MKETPIISSSQNPRIKQAEALLDKARERKKQRKIIIEGEKEILQAHKAGVIIETLFITEKELTENLTKWHDLLPNVEIWGVSGDAYKKIAYRESTVEVVAIAQMPILQIENIKLPQNPLVLVIESVEKPGNLGAILRTADAAGVDAVLVCDTQTDLFNPNVIRSSLGCVFTLPIAVLTSAEALVWLHNRQINIWVTALVHGAISYTDIDFKKPSAIVMGTESRGVTDFWKKNATANIIIPMYGTIDSMNVSVATAITVFEAIRQRKAKLSKS